ncbi:MAG: hypothetical protein ACFCUV_14255 [Rivularia sp. (in: cyanobacteria)]
MSNTNRQPDEGIFESALANQRTVPETFFLDLSADETIAHNIHQSDEAVQHRIRRFMEDANSQTQFLFDFQTYGSDADQEVVTDLGSGAIAAIDSTDVLPITDLMNTSFYAVGVGCITSQNRQIPEVVLILITLSWTFLTMVWLTNSILTKRKIWLTWLWMIGS